MSLLKQKELIAGRYKILEFVGAGGMQEVYKANDESLGRVVALKTPKSDHAERRFERSAIVSATVKHPNIATTFDYFIDGGRAYLVEEFITGLDLKEVLAETYFYMDPALACHLAVHLAKGLEACHRHSIWHRDFKPANIMVDDPLCFSVLKITDFGIAKMVESEFDDESDGGQETSITKSQTLLGALPYMAPECIADIKTANYKADIWSFGAIIHHVLSGAVPFGSGLAAVPAIIKGAYKPLPPWTFGQVQFKRSLKELWEIVRSCLVVERDRRPPAGEIVEALSGLCYSVYPRYRGKVLASKWRNRGFIGCRGKDVFYHADSAYQETLPAEGEVVAFSKHKGTPRDRAFPMLTIRK